MNQPIPECMPCILRFKDPAEQLDYMLYVKAMISLGFSLDTTNNLYTRLVDGKTMAYLTTIYSKDEMYDYVKGCIDKGFNVTGGPKAPSLSDLRAYQQSLLNDENKSYQDILDNKGMGLYLENYLDIIKQRNEMAYQEPAEGIKMGR